MIKHKDSVVTESKSWAIVHWIHVEIIKSNRFILPEEYDLSTYTK